MQPLCGVALCPVVFLCVRDHASGSEPRDQANVLSGGHFLLQQSPGLGGSLVALASPFIEHELDIEELAKLCERQIDRGTCVLIPCTATGEARSLSRQEYAASVQIAVRSLAGRVPVIAGCDAHSTVAALSLAEVAASFGVDALLCTLPPSILPAPKRIATHIRAIRYATGLPVILEDGRRFALADETIVRLFQNELIVGITDTGGDISRPPRLRAQRGDQFLQWSGDDATAAAHRAMGGSGSVSAAANLFPALCSLMHSAWDNAEFGTFAAVRDLLAPLNALLRTESDPIALKAALETAGLCSGELRRPLTHATLATQERLLRTLPGIMAAEEHAARGIRTSKDSTTWQVAPFH